MMKSQRACKLKGILLLLLMLSMSACSNTQTKDAPDLQSDDGYKPVIMYQGTLYWLSTEKAPVELPKGYVDSQKKVETCLDDAMQLPKEELSTSAKYCSGVGTRILINEEDESKIITATEKGSYQVFEKDQ